MKTQIETEKSEAKGETGEGAGCDLGQRRRRQDNLHSRVSAPRSRKSVKGRRHQDFDIGLRNLDLILGAGQSTSFMT